MKKICKICGKRIKDGDSFCYSKELEFALCHLSCYIKRDKIKCQKNKK